MVKLDEHSEHPELDERVRSALAAALDRPGVVAGVMFGSHATGRAGPLSDIDLGVWVTPDLPQPARYELQLQLMNDAAQAVGSDAVEVVVLNDATPLLRYQVLRDGVRLVERDPRTLIRLETRALLEYLDTAPLRATLAEGIRSRIKDGGFGRR